jgi:hypothetical protein
MTTLEKVEDLRQQAIGLLLSEREQIDQRLNQLGHGQQKAAPSKRRGRPPKSIQPDAKSIQPEGPELSVDHS